MIASNLAHIKSEIPSEVTLVAVSKTKSLEEINEAFDCGHRHFGENKVQELVKKYESLPNEIRWHFIGHLQRNKVKYIAPFVHLIHAVDSMKLLREINKQALKHNRTINVLLQFHIAQEESKFGLDMGEASVMLNSNDIVELKNIRIVGVMGMASYTDNRDQIRKEFTSLRNVFESVRGSHFDDQSSFCELSMGMSGDYPIAIEEGSTMIRVGSLIFGERE